MVRQQGTASYIKNREKKWKEEIRYYRNEMKKRNCLQET